MEEILSSETIVTTYKTTYTAPQARRQQSTYSNNCSWSEDTDGKEHWET
jgi:hypothetical protein